MPFCPRLSLLFSAPVPAIFGPRPLLVPFLQVLFGWYWDRMGTTPEARPGRPVSQQTTRSQGLPPAAVHPLPPPKPTRLLFRPSPLFLPLLALPLSSTPFTPPSNPRLLVTDTETTQKGLLFLLSWLGLFLFPHSFLLLPKKTSSASTSFLTSPLTFMSLRFLRHHLCSV